MKSDKPQEPSGSTNGFGKRHPGMGKIVFADDDTTFKGKLRKHLRNPPMRTALLIVIIIVAIPVAIAYPKVSSVAEENWTNVQRARERHFVHVTAASWIYPFLRRQTVRMQEADVPIEWRGVSFVYGPCFPQNLDQLPVGKYSYSIRTACTSLHEIQTKYSDDCAQTSACNIPEEAKFELQIVLDRLKVAFSDANLVQPPTDDQGQIRD